jgi:hypothetical protein
MGLNRDGAAPKQFESRRLHIHWRMTPSFRNFATFAGTVLFALGNERCEKADRQKRSGIEVVSLTPRD